MNYEKKYKEALERAKLSRQQLFDIGEEATEIEHIFPELKENEGERIRKEILEYFRQFDNEKLRGVDISDWISWLEMQGEPQPYKGNGDTMRKNLIKAFKLVGSNHCGRLDVRDIIHFLESKDAIELEKQDEQNHVWSKEDEEMKRTIVSNLFILKGMYTHPDKQIDYNNMIEWLKSLKLQSHWKPTQEQMTALKIVKNGFPSDDLDAIESLYNDLKKL